MSTSTTASCDSTDTFLSSPEITLDNAIEYINAELDDSEIKINARLLNQGNEGMDFSTPLHILAKRFDVLYESFKKIIDINKNLKLNVERIDRNCKFLKKENDELWDSLHDVEKELYATQQYSRRENIEITGIPSNIQDRDLEQYVIHRVLRRIGLNELVSFEIVACHRLGKSSPSRPSNVIVRFLNRKRAYEALENRRNLKNFPDLTKMFIIESLCPHYKEIFERCKELKKEGQIKAVWSYNGTVQFKTEDNRNIRGQKVFHLASLNAYIKDGRPIDALRENNFFQKNFINRTNCGTNSTPDGPLRMRVSMKTRVHQRTL